MNVREMRRREDIDTVLRATLQRGWSRQHGDVRLGAPDEPGQRWSYLPLVGAFAVADVGRVGRRWLRDNIRHTPFRRRAIPQWIVGTAITSRPVLRRVAQPAFTVRPALPRPHDLVVVPGNQRVRIFDFGSGRSRVLLKEGFDAGTMRNEIAVRGDGAAGPFPPIVAHGGDGAWFEEPLVDGWAVPRCPPGVDRAARTREALRRLDRWTRSATRQVAASEHAADVHALARALAAEVGARYGRDMEDVEALLDRLTVEASRTRTIRLARTHGDFQAGNLLVPRSGGPVMILDWEHAGERTRWYDVLVLGLGIRFAAGRSARLRAFVLGDDVPEGLPPEAEDPAWRRLHVAWLLLEDLVFHLAQGLTGPYRDVPDLRAHLAELRSLGPRLEGLLGEAP
ncbi:MAG: phosphotransferase [Myxococcota bacterium]